MNLPTHPVYNTAFPEFKEKNIVLIDVIKVGDGDRIALTFTELNSPWRQGVWIKSNGILSVNDVKSSSFYVWHDDSDVNVIVHCISGCTLLWIYNIWDRGNGIESQSHTSGMMISAIGNIRKYGCNDIGFKTMFNKLIFTTELLPAK